MPGVRTVTFSSVPLLSGIRQNNAITVPGLRRRRTRRAAVNINGLAPNFFAAMELPIVLGRGFTDRDDLGTPRSRSSIRRS